MYESINNYICKRQLYVNSDGLDLTMSSSKYFFEMLLLDLNVPLTVCVHG